MKHLADHISTTDSTGARLVHFLRLARDRSETVWAQARQKPRLHDEASRRVAEYLWIARGREV